MGILIYVMYVVVLAENGDPCFTGETPGGGRIN
jgi:hypothetical protein